jgi:hypothetical protein
MFDFELKKKHGKTSSSLSEKQVTKSFQKNIRCKFSFFLPGTFYITTEKN